MIIDSHCHPWAYWPYLPPVPDPENHGAVEQLIHQMDVNGVDRATIVCAQIFRNFDNNDYVAAALKQYPERLEQFADPDGICVSEVVYDLVRRSMPIGFECIGQHDLKNIDAPVTIYKVRDDIGPSVAAPNVRTPKSALSVPDRPSIAVLPLTNLSPSADMDFFADGIAD